MPPTRDQLARFSQAVDASYKVVPQKEDSQELAFAFGMEVRLNLRAALTAAGEAVAVGITITHILSGKPELSDIAGVGVGFQFWSTFLNAIRRKMKALQYVVCLVLTENSDGLKAEDVLPRAREFAEKTLIKKPKANWLGGGSGVFKDALIQLKDNPTPKDFLKEMQEAGWIQKKKGRFVVKQRHFTLGLTENA